MASLTLFVLQTNLSFLHYPQIHTTKSNTLKWVLNPAPSDQNPKDIFVEANPNITENKPDETDFFSFQDQQSANPQNDSEKKQSHTPNSKGETDNKKILHATQKQTKSTRPTSPKELIGKSFIKNNAPTNTDDVGILKLPGVHPKISKIDNGSGFHSKERTDSEIKVIKIGESQNNHFVDIPISNKLKDLHKVRLKPRPKLGSDVINGPLLKSESKATRIGNIAIECKLHPYGIYVQQMLQSIEAQWGQLVKGSRNYIIKDHLQQSYTYEFILEANGRIKSLVSLGSDNGSLASDLCRQAISSRAPFGNWTNEMIQEIGNSDTITIKFRYL